MVERRHVARGNLTLKPNLSAGLPVTVQPLWRIESVHDVAKLLILGSAPRRNRAFACETVRIERFRGGAELLTLRLAAPRTQR